MPLQEPVALDHEGSRDADIGIRGEMRRLYPELEEAAFQHLAREFEQMDLAGGQILVREGEPSDALYVLLNGRLEAVRTTAGKEVPLGEIGRGEMIGEMSLFDAAGRRTATVRALRDSRLLRMSNRAFLGFMQVHPSVTRQFIQLLMRRMASKAMRRAPVFATVAVLPAAIDPGAMQRMWHELAATLGKGTSVFPVERGLADARFPGCLGGPEENRVTAWLNDEEQAHRLVLYRAGAQDDAWTRLCLRQADCVLLVADAASRPPPGLLETWSGRVGRHCELLLLREPGAAPQGTSEWLASSAFARHHHMRWGSSEDMERLGRHLTGRSIGLTLGGGGARAFAEIGVLRALSEARIPVDVIGGTSMGAVIGALAAQGEGAQAIQQRMREALRLKPFSGLTLPLVSLLSGAPLTAMLDSLFGAQRIEDLPLRYLCVASNLTRGVVHVPESGLLAHWLRASNAVPGVVPPVIHGGELFVDGGLINNVPVDVVADRNSGPVIAVNVSGQAALRTRAPDHTPLSGWRLLLSRHRADVPSLAQMIVRSMLLASSNNAAAVRELAALHIAPELPGYDVGDWDSLDQLVAAGYEAALAALDTWDGKAVACMP